MIKTAQDYSFVNPGHNAGDSYGTHALIPYWTFSNLEGTIINITITTTIRYRYAASGTATGVFFKNWSETKWNKSTVGPYYYAPSSGVEGHLFSRTESSAGIPRYKAFGDILAELNCTVSFPKSGTNTEHTFNFDLSSLSDSEADVSNWNGIIYFSILPPSSFSENIIWTRNQPWSITVTCEKGSTLFHYYTSSKWADIKSLSYYNGTKWVPVKSGTYYPSAITVPPAPFTSNSGNNGYSCSASTVYNNNNNFGAWRAFDGGLNGDYGWCSSTYDSGGSESLYLNLPKKAYVKTVTIQNRASAGSPRGPYKAQILGKVSSSSTTEIVLSE